MDTVWGDYELRSPVSVLINKTAMQFQLWTEQLSNSGMKFDKDDAIQYWNLISAIYALTDEENLEIRATDTYMFSGGSKTTGKRRLGELIKSGLVKTKENPERRTEKFVSVSEDAKQAVLTTLDSWVMNFKDESNFYQKHRDIQKYTGKDPDEISEHVDEVEEKMGCIVNSAPERGQSGL